MSQNARAGAAVVAALASSLGLAGCSPAYTEDAMASSVVSAVRTVDHVTDSVASFSSSGPGGTSLTVNIYVDTTDEGLIVKIADESLNAIWRSVAVRPNTVSITVATIPKPQDPERIEPNAIDPSPIAEGLAIPDSRVIRQTFMVFAASMDQRYGSWTEPAP